MVLLVELLCFDVLCGKGGSSKFSKSRSQYSSSVTLSYLWPRQASVGMLLF